MRDEIDLWSSLELEGEERRGGERVAFCESDICLVDFSAFNRGVSMLIPVWLKWMGVFRKKESQRVMCSCTGQARRIRYQAINKVVAEC